MDELEWEIAQVDPRKTIQMGSFRINPDGSQSVVEVSPEPGCRGVGVTSGAVSRPPQRCSPGPDRPAPQVPYARSEAHLTELLERICEKMKEYGEKVDPSTHRKSYVRVISHDGTKLDLSGVKIDGDVASSLKFAVRAGAAAGLGAPWVPSLTHTWFCCSVRASLRSTRMNSLSSCPTRLTTSRTGSAASGRVSGEGDGGGRLPSAARTGGASRGAEPPL